jgi:UDP-N-acetylmuramoyl-tripeptide--D-alanyl-D-alanine ligase
MIPMSLAEIAAVLAGRLHGCDGTEMVTGEWFVNSREPVPGGLFAALPGEHVDGHRFAPSAVDAGAAGALVTRPVAAPAVLVDDVQAALGRLAAHLIARRDELTVIALTGSSGKTTTKDLVAQLLGRVALTVATPGSFNNEIGLPLTVSRLTNATRHLVLEMGARGIGHIRYLTDIAPPTIAAVLNVGASHIGEFGGIDAIASGKGEIVEALRPDGTAILNADDARVSAMAARTVAPVVRFGRAPHADVRAERVTVDEQGRAAFVLRSGGDAHTVGLRLLGEHQVANALAAAAIAQRVGMSLADIADGLSVAQPASRWRMQVTRRADGITVLNDAYNANPESMIAALHTLAAMAGGRRTIAVLGPMLGLGDAERSEHFRIGAVAAQSGISEVVAIGDRTASFVRDGAHARGLTVTCCADQVDALARVHELLAPGDIVLVKGSRTAGLESLAEQLARMPAADHSRPPDTEPSRR